MSLLVTSTVVVVMSQTPIEQYNACLFLHRHKCMISTTTKTTSTTLSTSVLLHIYTTHSSPNSSQWLILRSISIPLQINASTYSLPLPEYPSLSLLNTTTIGYVCTSTALPPDSGACLSFTFVNQPGWFYDPYNSFLYIHYDGSTNTTITVIQ